MKKILLCVIILFLSMSVFSSPMDEPLIFKDRVHIEYIEGALQITVETNSDPSEYVFLSCNFFVGKETYEYGFSMVKTTVKGNTLVITDFNGPIDVSHFDGFFVRLYKNKSTKHELYLYGNVK